MDGIASVGIASWRKSGSGFAGSLTLNNRASPTSPDIGITSFTHDAAGNVLTRTDSRGMIATMSYDAVSRLTAVAYSGSSGGGSGTDNGSSLPYNHDPTGATTCAEFADLRFRIFAQRSVVSTNSLPRPAPHHDASQFRRLAVRLP